MRAVLCESFSGIDHLKVGEKADPVPGPGEVVIDVRAATVQYVDIKVVEGKSLLNTNKLDHHFGRKINLELPLTPGSEAAGVISAVGEGVTRFKVGDRVLGSALVGGWAEKMRLQEDEACLIPDGMDWLTGGAFYVLYFTASYALMNKGGLQPDDTVLVLGAGSGAGLAAVEIAKAIGAYVVAAASTDEKLALAKDRGADSLLKYPAGPLDLAAQKQLAADYKLAANGREITVVADYVGGDYAEPAMRAMAFKARYLSVGFSAGVPSIPMHVIFNKNGSIIGVEPVADGRLPGENPELMTQLFAWAAEGKLKPVISRTFPLESVREALNLLNDRKSVGRVMLELAPA